MKIKLSSSIVLLMMLLSFQSNAQDVPPAVKYNMMKTDYQTKNLESATTNLLWCLDNSPSLTANIYIYGGAILKERLQTVTPETKQMVSDLGYKLFKLRAENFPSLDPAKANNDFAEFLIEIGASDDEIFSALEKAYKIDPTKLGVKSLAIYFQGVVKRNKDTSPQVIFDTYDDTVEAIDKKLEEYSDNIQELKTKEESGQPLSTTEKKNLDAYVINSDALGQIGPILDQSLEEVSTCEYLVKLYQQKYEDNKSNTVWLARAINRMFKKECTDSPLYAKLVGKYQEVNPSPEASVLYAGVLMDKGETNKAVEYFEKAISQETDNAKKTKNLLIVADIFRKKGQYTKAVSYAKKAIAIKPNAGRAYTIIATCYASAANSCGNSEFTKRMVYAAAENYARKGASVDAGVAVYANRLAAAYASNKPSKKLVFNNELGLKSGDSYRIGCWIGETVRVP